MLLLFDSGGGYAMSDEWGRDPPPNPEKCDPPKRPPLNMLWLFFIKLLDELGLLCSGCWLLWSPKNRNWYQIIGQKIWQDVKTIIPHVKYEN